MLGIMLMGKRRMLNKDREVKAVSASRLFPKRTYVAKDARVTYKTKWLVGLDNIKGQHTGGWGERCMV